MNFLEFKNEYINTLEAFLKIKAFLKIEEQNYQPSGDNIAFLYSQKLANELIDMGEENPVWLEKIKDQIEKTLKLQFAMGDK